MRKFALLQDNEVKAIENEIPYGKYEPGLKWVEFDDEKCRVEIGFIHNPTKNTFERKRKTLEIEKRECFVYLNMVAEKAFAGILGDVPDFEQKTFPTQQIEMLYYYDSLKNNTPIDPERVMFCSNLAKIRGIPFDFFMQKVRDKTHLIAQYTSALTGERQRFEDVIGGIENFAQIDELYDQINAWGVKYGV